MSIFEGATILWGGLRFLRGPPVAWGATGSLWRKKTSLYIYIYIRECETVYVIIMPYSMPWYIPLALHVAMKRLQWSYAWLTSHTHSLQIWLNSWIYIIESTIWHVFSYKTITPDLHDNIGDVTLSLVATRWGIISNYFHRLIIQGNCGPEIPSFQFHTNRFVI